MAVAVETLAERTHRYRDVSRQVIFLGLTEYRSTWMRLHPGEIEPQILEAVQDERVLWSSFWPSSPDDTIELLLTEDGMDTLVRLRWVTSSPPDARGVAISRQRPNTKLGADIRGWLADDTVMKQWPGGRLS